MLLSIIIYQSRLLYHVYYRQILWYTTKNALKFVNVNSVGHSINSVKKNHIKYFSVTKIVVISYRTQLQTNI